MCYAQRFPGEPSRHDRRPVSAPCSLTLLGTGAMGTALGRAWLAAGHPLTCGNHTPERTAALTAEERWPPAALRAVAATS